MKVKHQIVRIVIQFLFGSLCFFGMVLAVVFLLLPIIGVILTYIEKIAGTKFIYLINSELLLAILITLFAPIGGVVGVILGHKLIVKTDSFFNIFQITIGYLLGIIGFIFFLWGIPYILELFWHGVDSIGPAMFSRFISCPGSVLFTMVAHNAALSSRKN